MGVNWKIFSIFREIKVFITTVNIILRKSLLAGSSIVINCNKRGQKPCNLSVLNTLQLGGAGEFSNASQVKDLYSMNTCYSSSPLTM